MSQGTDAVDEIVVVNAEKVVLDGPTSEIIADMAATNKTESTKALLYLIRLMLIAFSSYRKENGFMGNIRVEKGRNTERGFTNVDLNAIQKQYEGMKQKVVDTEGIIGEIERSSKSTLTEVLTPLFSNLSASVSALRAEVATRADVSKIETDVVGIKTAVSSLADINSKPDQLIKK